MRNPALPFLLASLLVILGACSNSSDEGGRSADFSPATGVDLNAECEWESVPENVLASLDWEVFEGTIQPGQAGFLHGTMTTWGPGCDFSIQVPADALPSGYGTTEFSISIPTKASFEAYDYLNCGRGLPLIMRLEPSGLMFQAPVTVHGTYMPWVTVDPPGNWVLWTEEPSFLQTEPIWTQHAKGKWTFAAELPHFSDWELGGGGPDGVVIPLD